MRLGGNNDTAKLQKLLARFQANRMADHQNITRRLTRSCHYKALRIKPKPAFDS